MNLSAAEYRNKTAAEKISGLIFAMESELPGKHSSDAAQNLTSITLLLLAGLSLVKSYFTVF